MPLKCSCGNDNPDGAIYCNLCGGRLSQQDGTMTGFRCNHVNPDHKEYCGRCGADLDRRNAGSVLSGDLPSPVHDDVYVKWGSPDDHSFWMGTVTLTKSQYMLRLALGIIATLLVFPVALKLGGLACGTLFLLLMFGTIYFFWLIGRVDTEESG